MASSAEVTNRARNRLGSVLNGKWRLDEILGIGGMATVYAAMHRNQKRGAVKMLHPELSLDEAVKTRFLREGYVANTVDHPGAVTVFDDDVSEDGAAFLVMELLEGETVHARLQREGVLPLSEALAIADQILDVLAAAHEKGIVHRDLKPENFFITRSGQVKLLDFGIARLRELPLGTAGTTATGFFMGTPSFMSPEHARGKWSEVDAQSDVWSVGASLFTMITGTFVHESETPMDTLVLAVTKQAPPIRDVMSDVPEEVAEVVDGALEFHKNDRWDSALTMQAALRSAALTLVPEEYVVRGMQPMRVPDDHPSHPVPSASATVRSARTAARGPLASLPAPSTHSSSPVAMRAVDAESSLEPPAPAQRSGSGVSVTASGRVPKARGYASIVVAIASLAVLIFVIVSNTRSHPEQPSPGAPISAAQATSGAGLSVVTSPEPPAAVDTIARAQPVPSILPAAAASSVAQLATSSRPNLATTRPQRPSPSVPKGSQPVATQSVVPSPPPRSSAEPRGAGANPFDRRF